VSEQISTEMRHEKLLAFFLLRGVTLFSVGLCTQEGAHLRCGVRKGVHRAVVLSECCENCGCFSCPGVHLSPSCRGEQARMRETWACAREGREKK
jgi:hypothetical protein